MIPNAAQESSAQLPGSPAGTPNSPGTSPVVAPGGGAGNKAAAIAILKNIVPQLYKLLAAFPFGSEENTAVTKAITALGKIAGKTDEDSLVPAALQQMAASKTKEASPVGMAAAPQGATA